MNLAAWLNPPPLLVEIGPNWLRARHGDASVELPLERGPEGRLTAPGKEKVALALRNFLKARSWLPRARAWCALGSRGISLRRMTLPNGTAEELNQRLRLQIEAEFPLPPEELAWGYQPLGTPPPANGAPGRRELLLAAVKKELVADYHGLLHASGADPVFTLAAVARWNYCGRPTGSFAMLEVADRQAELTLFENAVPTISRCLAWPGDNASQPADGPLEALAKSIKGSVAGAKLYVTGQGVSPEFTERLAWHLGNGCKCERVGAGPSDSGSAALAGLEKFAAQRETPELAIRLEPASNGAAVLGSPDWKTWGARAGVLAAACLVLPYAEALLLKPHLERKVAAFKAEAARLKVIDRELDFLRGLKLSQPPYLDLLTVFSKASPPGTRFDSLSLNSKGEVALRASFHDGQQVAAFRNQLMASGFFTNVVVEEQVPTPDRQKVNIRLSALERGPADLQSASARLAAGDAKAKETGATNAAPTATTLTAHPINAAPAKIKADATNTLANTKKVATTNVAPTAKEEPK